MPGSQEDFAGQQSGQICFHSQFGNAGKDEKQTQGQGTYMLKEGRRSFSKAVKDAAQGGGQVHKGAEPAENPDVGSGRGIFKYAGSKFSAVKTEDAGTEDPHIQAVAEGHGHCRGDPFLFSFRLGLGYSRQKQDSQGIGNGRRKHDKRQSHSGQNTVYGKGSCAGQPKGGETVWNPDSFCTSQQI